jgi:hypothetical protein
VGAFQSVTLVQRKLRTFLDVEESHVALTLLLELSGAGIYDRRKKGI